MKIIDKEKAMNAGARIIYDNAFVRTGSRIEAR